MAKFNEYKDYVKSSGGFMTLKQGENKVRVVSEFEQFEDEFQGKPKTRFMGYVIDRVDGQIKPLTTGPQIFSQLGELSVSSEYGFDGIPPYDVIIKKSGEGMDTEYTVMAARKNTELAEAEQLLVKDLKPIIEIVESMLNKKQKKAETKVVDGIPIIETDDTDYDDKEKINPEDIPF